MDTQLQPLPKVTECAVRVYALTCSADSTPETFRSGLRFLAATGWTVTVSLSNGAPDGVALFITHPVTGGEVHRFVYSPDLPTDEIVARIERVICRLGLLPETNRCKFTMRDDRTQARILLGSVAS
jgi:hypothetical protein